MRPRGPTWPRNDPLGTETSHTGPCSLNVAQLARSIGWVLVVATANKQPLWSKSGRTDGLRDHKGFAAVNAQWRRTFKLVNILAILIAHHSGDLSAYSDISLKYQRRQRRLLSKHQMQSHCTLEEEDEEEETLETGAGSSTAEPKVKKRAKSGRKKKSASGEKDKNISN